MPTSVVARKSRIAFLHRSPANSSATLVQSLVRTGPGCFLSSWHTYQFPCPTVLYSNCDCDLLRTTAQPFLRLATRSPKNGASKPPTNQTLTEWSGATSRIVRKRRFPLPDIPRQLQARLLGEKMDGGPELSQQEARKNQQQEIRPSAKQRPDPTVARANSRARPGGGTVPRSRSCSPMSGAVRRVTSEGRQAQRWQKAEKERPVRSWIGEIENARSGSHC